MRFTIVDNMIMFRCPIRRPSLRGQWSLVAQVIMIRFIQIIFSVKQQKFNKQAKTAITKYKFEYFTKDGGKIQQ